MSDEGDREQPPAGESPEEGAAEEPVRPEGSAGRERPSEEELRRRLDEELRKLRVQDVLLQSVVSLINLTSRRIAKEDEQDLDQARVGIDAVRALVDFLDPDAASQVRNAVSELQVAYAREAGGGGAGEARSAPPGEGEPGGQPPERPEEGQGPEPGRPSKLWTPPGT
jgi:hypothetical protein